MHQRVRSLKPKPTGRSLRAILFGSPLRVGAVALFSVVFALIGLALFAAWQEKERCEELYGRADDWNARVHIFDAGGGGDYAALLAEEQSLIREGIEIGCNLRIE